ncbi:MAG TPA: PEP-CTERM sorting domain-containing protein [Roseiarcus sp.]
MNRASVLGSVAALTLCGAILPASAAIVDVTFTGTIFFMSYDSGITPIFVPGGLAPSSSFDGKPYTANFVFNTDLGSSTSSATGFSVQGGSSTGFTDPLVSASVTVNGVTENIPGLYDSELTLCSSSCPSTAAGSLTLYASDYSNGGPTGSTTNNRTYLVIDGAFPSSIIPGPFSFTPSSGVGYISLSTAANDGNGTLVNTYFEALLTTATVTVAASAPEPSTWAMMLIAFAGLGFAGYRGRRRAVAAA